MATETRIDEPVFNIGDKVTYHGGIPGTITKVRMIGPVNLGSDNHECLYQRIYVEYSPADIEEDATHKFYITSREGASCGFEAAAI